MGSVPSEFALRFQEVLSYVYPVAQILFWLVIGAMAIWATMLFKRYVDRVAGLPGEASRSERISVEEFVE